MTLKNEFYVAVIELYTAVINGNVHDCEKWKSIWL